MGYEDYKIKTIPHLNHDLVCSPSNLRDGTLGEGTHKQLSNLIHHQDTQCEGKRYQPELDGDRSSVKEVFDAFDLGHEDGDDERSEGAKEKPGVTSFGSNGVSLKD